MLFGRTPKEAAKKELDHGISQLKDNGKPRLTLLSVVCIVLCPKWEIWFADAEAAYVVNSDKNKAKYYAYSLHANLNTNVPTEQNREEKLLGLFNQFFSLLSNLQ